MKQLKIVCSITLLALLFFFAACQKESISESINELTPTSDLSSGTVDQDLIKAWPPVTRRMRTIPFKSKFSTWRMEEKENEVECNDPSLPGPNYQQGGGRATYLGNFKTIMTFCVGPGSFYGGARGYFEAANGDRLFFKIERGQVKLLPPGSDPVYEAYFKDPFEFCGGTGRFEGASGSGMTDSMVDLWNEENPFPGPIIEGHRTDHKWTGKLILPRR